jgi:alcohol dehydrogenase class IV
MLTTWRGPRQIVEGPGAVAALPRLVADLGERVLIVTDPIIAGLPALTHIRRGLEDAGVAVSAFEDARADVPFDVIDHCLETATEAAPDSLVAIGGGSVIDLAKAVATLLTHRGNIRDYYGENRVPGPVTPVVAVPTTAGTGAEVTTVSVISDPDHALKVGISSVHLIPTFAVCDPDLTLSCPPTLTAHSGIDALCHAVESVTSAYREVGPLTVVEGVYLGKNPESDRLALHAVSVIAEALPLAVADGQDQRARSEMMRAATAAGLAFAHSGVGVPHALQYPIGAATHTPHGLGVGLLLPYVLNANRALIIDELALLARAVGVPDGDFIDWVSDLNSRIGIPSDLRSIGVERDQLADFADLAVTARRLIQNDRGPGTTEHLLPILEAAWAGDRGLVS